MQLVGCWGSTWHDGLQRRPRLVVHPVHQAAWVVAAQVACRPRCLARAFGSSTRGFDYAFISWHSMFSPHALDGKCLGLSSLQCDILVLHIGPPHEQGTAAYNLV